MLFRLVPSGVNTDLAKRDKHGIFGVRQAKKLPQRGSFLAEKVAVGVVLQVADGFIFACNETDAVFAGI